MKKIISIVAFCLVALCLISIINPVFVDKAYNRYYMLSRELEKHEDIDVQVYGSCHAYTSFDSLYFSEKTGLNSYNMANPSEIMPATYLRMYERFKEDVPEVVLVETWGLNAYQTYITKEEIFDSYFGLNIEDIPVSLEKLSVINDYECLDYLEENLYIAKYKDRLLDFSLSEVDFKYSFEKAAKENDPTSIHWLYEEMKNRFSHKGFKANPSEELLDYEEQQAKVNEQDVLAIEEDLVYYLDKIIELCNNNEVEVIFYRAPYRSSEEELKKVNYLAQYLKEKQIVFYDLEKEIEFDYKTDFFDYEHLSASGARECTEFLMGKILMKYDTTLKNAF